MIGISQSASCASGEAGAVSAITRRAVSRARSCSSRPSPASAPGHRKRDHHVLARKRRSPPCAAASRPDTTPPAARAARAGSASRRQARSSRRPCRTRRSSALARSASAAASASAPTQRAAGCGRASVCTSSKMRVASELGQRRRVRPPAGSAGRPPPPARAATSARARRRQPTAFAKRVTVAMLTSAFSASAPMLARDAPVRSSRISAATLRSAERNSGARSAIRATMSKAERFDGRVHCRLCDGLVLNNNCITHRTFGTIVESSYFRYHGKYRQNSI